MAREGYPTLIAILIASVFLALVAAMTGSVGATVSAVVGGLFLVFVGYFFRDPDRVIPVGEGIVVSPGDGKVVQITEVNDDLFVKSKARQISIFLSLFDVHVNRIPMTGTIAYFNYVRGKFVQAFRDEASVVNEQTIIGIENGSQRIVFKQIAGILARRIVCHVREGFSVKMGERFGIIKFGSRVDVLLPLDAEITVKLNQKVKGGESVLGKFTKK